MRDIWKYTLATFLGLCLFVGVGITGLVALVILGTLGREERGASWADGAILVLDLSMPLQESPPPRSEAPQWLLEEALAEVSVLTLRDVLMALEQAAGDDGIVGLYLRGGTPTADYATLREIRGAIAEFQTSGKPVLAYGVDWGEPDYYLASVANQVFMDPLGVMDLNGLSDEAIFWGDVLDRYGIGIQVIRVGKYKSAVETLAESGRSPEDRRQTAALLGDIWGDYRQTVAESRHLTPQALQAGVDSQGLLSATRAQDRQLVKLAYEDEVFQRLADLAPDPDQDVGFASVDIATYRENLSPGRQDSPNNTIALLYAEGEIVDGEGDGETVGGDRLAAQFRELRQDDGIKAVVLRINSPGGSATAASIIQREMTLLRAKKPLIVSMGPVAASGGYWIAAPAHQIFAHPNTITGSIGVYGLLPNFQALAERQGLRWDTVKTGRYADSWTLARPKDPAELDQQQQVVDQVYERFLAVVAQGRGLTPQQVATVAEGRVWSGLAAHRLGLVDRFGGLNEALEAAASQAKLGQDWQVEEWVPGGSLNLRVVGQLLGDTQTSLWLPPSLGGEPLGEEWEWLRSLNDPRGVYARLPRTFALR